MGVFNNDHSNFKDYIETYTYGDLECGTQDVWCLKSNIFDMKRTYLIMVEK